MMTPAKKTMSLAAVHPDVASHNGSPAPLRETYAIAAAAQAAAVAAAAHNRGMADVRGSNMQGNGHQLTPPKGTEEQHQLRTPISRTSTPAPGSNQPTSISIIAPSPVFDSSPGHESTGLGLTLSTAGQAPTLAFDSHHHLELSGTHGLHTRINELEFINDLFQTQLHQITTKADNLEHELQSSRREVEELKRQLAEQRPQDTDRQMKRPRRGTRNADG
jgi:hypothetical protein